VTIIKLINGKKYIIGKILMHDGEFSYVEYDKKKWHFVKTLLYDDKEYREVFGNE
jgi:hypothetical protein